MQAENQKLMTLGEVARKNGVSFRQAVYAVDSYRIPETQRCGCMRLYDAETVQRIESSLRRTGALRPA